MLETVREYGLEQLAAQGEADAAHRRHALYFLHLAEEARPALDGADSTYRHRQLDREQDNLRAALTWSLGAAGDPLVGLRLSAALWRYWQDGGYSGEGRAWLERALNATAHLAPSIARAEALLGAAELALDRDYEGVDGAHGLLEESRSLWQALGNRQGVARTQRRLGHVAFQQGDLVRARALLEASVSRLREEGVSRDLVWALTWLGAVDARQGDYASAHAQFSAAAAHARAMGNTNDLLTLTITLTHLAWLRGDAEAADACFAACLAMCGQAPEDNRLAGNLQYLGLTVLLQGKYEEATPLLEAALALQSRYSLDDRVALTLCHLGDVARCREDYERASTRYAESLSLYRRERHTQGIASVLHNQGHLALSAGDSQRAAALFGESLRLFVEIGYTWSIADCLAGFGGLAVAQGLPQRAARLLSAARAIHDSNRDQWANTPNQIVWGRNVARAQAQLGAAAWEAAWAEGQSMTREQAVAYALGPDGMRAYRLPAE